VSKPFARLTSRQREVNRLSVEQVAVLTACAREDVLVPVTSLVWRRVRAGTPLPIARASLSRTLRRLWRQGLVELEGAYQGSTLTARLAYINEELAAIEADPEAAYAPLRETCQRVAFYPKTAADYLAFKRRLAPERRQHYPVKFVCSTEQGRARLRDHVRSEAAR
jgi:hypothetical protein